MSRLFRWHKKGTHCAGKEDQESGMPKCQVAEAETEMEDLFERAENALSPVYFPALTEDGLRQSDIRERVLRVSAKFSHLDIGTLSRFFDSVDEPFGGRLACFLILIEQELPDGA